MNRVWNDLSDRRKEKFWGINVLDELAGKIPSNYTVVIEGPPGSGKTSFALNMAYANARSGAKVLYVTTNEGKAKLIKVAEGLGLDIKTLIDEGAVSIVEFLSLGNDAFVNGVAEEVSKHIIEGFGLIIIDSITPILRTLTTYPKQRAFLHSVLYSPSKGNNVVMVLISDTLEEESSTESLLLRFVADVVVSMDYRPSSIFPRVMEIRKFRTRPVPTLPIHFSISSDGVKVVTLVSEAVSEEFVRRRKVISVEEGPPQKLLGHKIKPGTQIGIVIRPQVPGLGTLLHYIGLKSTVEALRERLNISIVTHGSNPFIDAIINVGKRALGSRLRVFEIDLSKGDIMHQLDPKEISQIDVMIGVGYEKLTEIYGIAELNNYLAVYTRFDRNLGITVFRVYAMNEGLPRVPSSLYSMSDTVIECKIDEVTAKVSYQLVKGTHAVGKPITVNDDELNASVKDLLRKLGEYVNPKGILNYYLEEAE